ncbi:hypothetical protein HU200_049983 [Digitaria exilis]|uniref:Calcium uniporter protein n=1 Tax=Digitaria exilis TaxID=1010633 RepID=A0A835E9B1_9POAL|nr:hypothetical protein HU200_049983 [Digitaria exilis]
MRERKGKPTKVTILRLESKDAGRSSRHPCDRPPPVLSSHSTATGFIKPLGTAATAGRRSGLPVRFCEPGATTTTTMSLWRTAASRLLLLLPRSPPLSRLPSATASSYALLLQTRPFSPPPPRQAPAEAEVTPAEARRLVRLVGVEALKRRLRDGQDEVVGYADLLDACVEAGAARTQAEAEALARAMDDAGVVLLFRDKAYLHPEKDFMERLFLSRQRKLYAAQKFDLERYLELQKHCRCPLEGHHPHDPKLHGL